LQFQCAGILLRRRSFLPAKTRSGCPNCILRAAPSNSPTRTWRVSIKTRRRSALPWLDAPPDLAGRLRVHEGAVEEFIDRHLQERDFYRLVRAVAHVGQPVVADVLQ